MTTTALCRNNPEQWDLDQGTLDQLRTAKRRCGQCPLASSCARDLSTRLARSEPPINGIQAGHAFGTNGQLLASDTQLKRFIGRRRAETPLPEAARELLQRT